MQRGSGPGFAAGLAIAQILCGQGVSAAGSAERELLRQELVGKAPPDWLVHVSDRGDMLLAFVTPPYQQAFDLWFEPEQLRARMLGFCPSAEDKIWSQLQPRQLIAIEPTVGGKSADAMRLACPRGRQQPPA